MRSRVLKPLQPVAARPAILHVLATTAELAPAATVVVHGPGADTLLARIVQQVAAAGEIDPRYRDALAEAQAAGLEVLAWQADVSPAGVTLARELPFSLDPG